MSHDDDDDDFVVPAGSRRSSYVPPSDDGEFTPSLPPVPEQETPTSSTGQVPTIGAADDEHIAQTPVFAESVEVPRIEPEAVGSIVIELPAEEPVEIVDVRDQFGLPLVGDPIDIPQVVVTDPLPDAVSGTGTDTVFDDNRLFPPIVSIDEVTSVEAEASIVPEPEIENEPFAEPVAEPMQDRVSEGEPELAHEPERTFDERVLPLLPHRESLTPAELAAQLGANGGMSSNDQMALLDAQIPLRERDSVAVATFLAAVGDQRDADADALIRAAADRFGDLVPELAAFAASDAEVPTEFSDDSTPITGIPVTDQVDHIDIVEIVEDADGNVVELSVTEIDEVVTVVSVESLADATSSRLDAGAAATEDDQAWSLAAPADVVGSEIVVVDRRRWWTVAAYVGSLVSVLMVSVGVTVFRTGSAPQLALVLAGIAVAVPFIELARRAAARTGSSVRALTEELFGTVAGRVITVVVGLAVVVTVVVSLAAALNGLGLQIAAAEVTQPVTAYFAEGTVGPLATAVVLLVGAIVAALPHRVFRALALVLAGWTAVGTGAIVAMGSALLLMSTDMSARITDPQIAAAASAGALTLVVGFAALFGFFEVSRVREARSGILWLTIGLATGALVLAGAVVAALLAADGTHYFFGLNPVLHIIAPTPVLTIGLGASAMIPALVFVTTLVFRFVASATSRDDRDDSHVAVRWSLVLVPVAFGVVAYLGLVPAVLENVPSLTTLALPVAIVIGLFAARGVAGRTLTSTVARVWLTIVALLLTAVALGFASSSGAAFEWIGFINAALTPLGYGLLYIDVFVPFAAALASFLIGLTIVAPSTRRAARTA